MIAFLCARCHTWADTGKESQDPTRRWNVYEKKEFMRDMILRTVIVLWTEGLVMVKP